MTTPLNPSNLNLQGAVDLSALANARQAQVAGAQARASAPAGTIVDVTEATFQDEVVTKSTSVPVMVDFWSARSALCLKLTPILEKLAVEFAGKVVLAKVDADSQPQLAQAFLVQSVPAVFLVLGGQAQPLFQDAITEAQARQLFEQIVALGEQAGAAGLVESGDEQVAETPAPAQPPLDPRIERAYDAIEKADWDAADAAYDEVLAASPMHEEAKAGKAQVGLLRRTDNIDLQAVAEGSASTIAEKLLKADALMLMGTTVEAFNELLDGVRTHFDDDRDQFKNRLLELFVVLGDTEEVRVARRSLTNALF